ncbi:hypothetical protein GGS26DRAFT_116311 [Hypomontagnella submonticulosa]|nr:hypothetical protein GGS26DRAFT_116311 [Hypomontagnella submonticulosa]
MRVSFLFHSILLAGSALAQERPPPKPDPSSSSLGVPPPPPGSTQTQPGSTAGPAPSGPPGLGAKCGKGYTYCGYMLTSNGHNFAPNDVSKAYCSGLQELCSSGKAKTDVSQAVFVCMNDQPSNVELLCACSGKCRNDAETNFIAHCDKPCINS